MSEMTLTITQNTLEKLIIQHVKDVYGINIPIESNNIKIMVKSKQNYRSEWEEASYQAVIKKVYTDY